MVVNLYTKFEVFILYGCGDIFDKKSGEKEKKQTQGRTNRRRPIFNPMLQFVVVNQYTRFELSILNGCGDIFEEKSGKKEKGTNKEEQIGEGPFSIP